MSRRMGGEKGVGITCFPMRRSGGAGGGSSFRASFSAAKTACAEGGERYSGPVPPFPGKNNPGEEPQRLACEKNRGKDPHCRKDKLLLCGLPMKKQGKDPFPVFRRRSGRHKGDSVWLHEALSENVYESQSRFLAACPFR